MDYYSMRLLLQLLKTLKRVDESLATIDLDDFKIEFDDNAANKAPGSTDLDAYLMITECKQLIHHAIDLSDLIADEEDR